MNSKALANLRTECGLTRKELAERIGCSSKMIRRLETGRLPEPSYALMAAIGEVLCPDDLDRFWAALRDLPDYYEERILFGKISAELEPGVRNLLKKLIDPEVKAPVPFALSSLAEYLYQHCGDSAVTGHSDILMDAFIESIQKSDLIDRADDLERWTMCLMRDLKELLSREGLPADLAERIKCSYSALLNSRMTNDTDARIYAVRLSFFSFYDTWDVLCTSPEACHALHMAMNIYTNQDNSYEMRKRVFHATVNFFSAIKFQRFMEKNWCDTSGL